MKTGRARSPENNESCAADRLLRARGGYGRSGAVGAGEAGSAVEDDAAPVKGYRVSGRRPHVVLAMRWERNSQGAVVPLDAVVAADRAIPLDGDHIRKRRIGVGEECRALVAAGPVKRAL